MDKAQYHPAKISFKVMKQNLILLLKLNLKVGTMTTHVVLCLHVNQHHYPNQHRVGSLQKHLCHVLHHHRLLQLQLLAVRLHLLHHLLHHALAIAAQSKSQIAVDVILYFSSLFIMLNPWQIQIVQQTRLIMKIIWSRSIEH